MLVVGLTGGIGSGKSTVSAMLAARGAVIIDADRIAREVVEPGGPAYQGVVDRFGPSILEPDGRIDRPALAALVFADDAARADLNALTHPAVGKVMAERMAAEAGTDHVVVMDIPLLVEGRSERSYLAGVLVVDCPEEIAVGRLVSDRGMAESDARARMAAQATREQRLARADFVVDNCGDRDHLAAEVERAWEWIRSLQAAVRAAGAL
ncbi:MAG TPA: dephospho-CoA kinase [Acidimicrobiales bacterium]|nr:dephospho-CoA kinase [Acidimicrobiales bacterium]